MSILCTLRNLNLTYGNKELFKDASLSLHHDDRIGLLGLNGHGKSSLFKILTGEVVPDTREVPFIFDKAKGLKDDSIKYTVFLVPQELPLEDDDQVTIKNFIYRFYPTLERLQTELDQINHQLGTLSDPKEIDVALHKQKTLMEEMENSFGWDLFASYESFLKYFGINNFDLKVRTLSGGEQKKILLSLGLSSPAHLVLWDEPTNHLDMESIKKLEVEINNSKNAFMIISHDRYLLSKLAKKIVHIKDGKIKSFEGSYQDYLEFLVEEEKARQALLARLKNGLRRETEWMRQGIKARGCRSKSRVDNYLELKDKVGKIKSQAKRKLELSVSHSGRKSKVLSELKNVGMTYGEKALFENISLTVNKGDKIGLLGANGVGKSTLVKLIAGVIEPHLGSVKRADDLLTQIFTQKREELDPEMTPFELLGEGDDFINLPDGRRTHVSSWFESFLFNKDNIHRPLKTFSGGERNRLQMAINFTRAGDLWIFDEPTNDLDLETLQILEQKLNEFKGSLIIISHDRAFMANITNKVWVLEDHKVEAFNGGYGQVEEYLEAVAMEKQINQDEKDFEPKPVPVKEEKKKTINKKEIKDLEFKAEKLEGDIAVLEEVISKFDYDNESIDKLDAMSKKKEELEGSLLVVYEKLEELQS
ncbi:MAG: ABC-F family ATP-binding cassette domain-containing protein [Bacteriovoracaceae bacterium]